VFSINYDKLENNAKKRLARVDHLEYVNQLEATVAQDREANYLGYEVGSESRSILPQELS
jgi:hypothetical protein